MRFRLSHGTVALCVLGLGAVFFAAAPDQSQANSVEAVAEAPSTNESQVSPATSVTFDSQDVRTSGGSADLPSSTRQGSEVVSGATSSVSSQSSAGVIESTHESSAPATSLSERGPVQQAESSGFESPPTFPAGHAQSQQQPNQTSLFDMSAPEPTPHPLHGPSENLFDLSNPNSTSPETFTPVTSWAFQPDASVQDWGPLSPEALELDDFTDIPEHDEDAPEPELFGSDSEQIAAGEPWKPPVEERVVFGDWDRPLAETNAQTSPGQPQSLLLNIEIPLADKAPIIPETPFDTGDRSVQVYDTAWQMFSQGTPTQANEYFATLNEYGFDGAWAAVLHHSPGTYLHSYNGGGQIGRLENGEIVLSDGYITRVREMLDAAARNSQKVGLVVAWQNTYLPGGNSGDDALSNRVEGTLTTANAYAYGRQMVDSFGDHPAVSMWVFCGDAGTNNTDANKEVWREMARAVRDAGDTKPINCHGPTANGDELNPNNTFRHLNYVGEWWLDAFAPETGHQQTSVETEFELERAIEAYGLPIWQGESRYFNITFEWISPTYRNPGVEEVVLDAKAAQRAGVSGYVYGDAGRWAWCAFQGGYGDSSPCNANDISASFGEAERRVIEVFSGVEAPVPFASPTGPQQDSSVTTSVPSVPFAPIANPTTTVATPSAPSAPSAPSVPFTGSLTVDRVIDSTISSGDGSNPNEENPMGRHERSLGVPQGWSWAQGPSRNSNYGNLRQNQFVELRCAVINFAGSTPNVPFRVNVRNGSYWQYDGSWTKAFDLNLSGSGKGAYLGTAGTLSGDIFESGKGAINWRREADGSFSAPWNPNAQMMHFWASRRHSPKPGQSAEFSVAEISLQQPDGRTVDLSSINVGFQCGLDYYDTTGGQGTKVPGPGIGKYYRATAQHQPTAWLTAPTADSGSFSAMASWLRSHPHPLVN